MPETGTLLIFRSDFVVEQEEFAVPEPGPNQVLMKVDRSQVSAGSEMNFFRLNPVEGPLQRRELGYMTVGRVLAVGNDVTEYAPGDRVLTCGHHASHWTVDVSDRGREVAEGNVIEPLHENVSDEEAGF